MRRPFALAVIAALTVAPRAKGDDDATRSAVAARFHADPAAAAIALRLLARDGIVVETEAAHRMDGGYRGTILIAPALPIGAARAHLAWADAAFADFDELFGALGVDAHYSHRPRALRYFRSVGRHTPSAYAGERVIAYNLDGSLMTSADSVRETLFHETFHLNDEEHGDWSSRALAPIFASIVARCAARTACLAPFAPGSTRVRGGTFYAFQPGNGVGEYAAELALRYYREQRAVLRGAGLDARAFKCGPDENARAWRALVTEFFGGVDRTPECG